MVEEINAWDSMLKDFLVSIGERVFSGPAQAEAWWEWNSENSLAASHFLDVDNISSLFITFAVFLAAIFIKVLFLVFIDSRVVHTVISAILSVSLFGLTLYDAYGHFALGYNLSVWECLVAVFSGASMGVWLLLIGMVVFFVADLYMDAAAAFYLGSGNGVSLVFTFCLAYAISWFSTFLFSMGMYQYLLLT